MPTHRAVTFVVQEEDVKVGVSGWRYDGAVHVCMTAWFPYQTGAQMIVMIAKVTSLFEYGAPFNRWQPINDDPQWLTTGMHVDRGDAGPVFRLSLIHISEPTRLLSISYAV